MEVCCKIIKKPLSGSFREELQLLFGTTGITRTNWSQFQIDVTLRTSKWEYDHQYDLFSGTVRGIGGAALG
jgi:hypothetical protein